jgi:hypothetical protein
MSNTTKVKSTVKTSIHIFGDWDMLILIAATIAGYFIYGGAYGAFFAFAYTFLAFFGALIGFIPFYGFFLYHGAYLSWLNTALPAHFGFHLTGLTWFVGLLGTIGAAILCIIGSIIALVLLGVVVAAILDL